MKRKGAKDYYRYSAPLHYYLRFVAHGALKDGSERPSGYFRRVLCGAGKVWRLEGVGRYTNASARRWVRGFLCRRHTTIVFGRAGHIIIGRFGRVR